MKLSKNLSLGEVVRSAAAKKLGIDNNPTKEHLENLKIIAKEVFQPTRDYFGVPIFISSGYRSKELNKKVGGSKTSQHAFGMALDLDADVFGGVTNKQMFDYIRANLKFTQLIYEYGTDENPAWVHVGYDKNNLKGEVLRVEKSKGYYFI